jgi:hypothetical protein
MHQPSMLSHNWGAVIALLNLIKFSCCSSPVRYSCSQVAFALYFVCVLCMRNTPGTRMHLVCV